MAEMKRQYGERSIGHLEMVGYNYTSEALTNWSNFSVASALTIVCL